MVNCDKIRNNLKNNSEASETLNATAIVLILESSQVILDNFYFNLVIIMLKDETSVK